MQRRTNGYFSTPCSLPAISGYVGPRLVHQSPGETQLTRNSPLNFDLTLAHYSNCLRLMAECERHHLTPRWHERSEVSHESCDAHDNHFANRCTEDYIMAVSPHISSTLIHFNSPPAGCLTQGEEVTGHRWPMGWSSRTAIMQSSVLMHSGGHVPPHTHQGIATVIAPCTQLLPLKQPTHTVKVLVCVLNVSR